MQQRHTEPLAGIAIVWSAAATQPQQRHTELLAGIAIVASFAATQLQQRHTELLTRMGSTRGARTPDPLREPVWLQLPLLFEGAGGKAHLFRDPKP